MATMETLRGGQQLQRELVVTRAKKTRQGTDRTCAGASRTESRRRRPVQPTPVLCTQFVCLTRGTRSVTQVRARAAPLPSPGLQISPGNQTEKEKNCHEWRSAPRSAHLLAHVVADVHVSTTL
jgi:hypothetical protein